MDVTPIIDPLNDAQREAVTAADEPVLVIAGAGSGKTRVLVHRAAWLIRVGGVAPQSLLAVTFTNKAANEMRSRIESLLDMPAQHLWIGTFHGLAHRLLRRHWREAGLPQSFQIIDSDDQQRLIKRMLRGMELDESRWVPKEVQWFINNQKDEGLRPDHLDDGGDPNRRRMIELYRPTRHSATAQGWWTSPSCCCGRMSSGATTPSCWPIISAASATCWWTSSRTPTPSSTPG